MFARYQGVYMLGKFQDEGANLMQVWTETWSYDVDDYDGGRDDDDGDGGNMLGGHDDINYDDDNNEGDDDEDEGSDD